MLKIEHTICPTCSVGCGLNIISKNDTIVGINAYKNHEINEGRNCNNCTDTIELFKNNKEELSEDYETLLNKVTDLLNSADNGRITVICSGRLNNEDLDKIISFTNNQKYNLITYEYNFSKIDSDILASYEEVEKADKIITIGDIYRNNPLIARRIIHAKENGCYTININNHKNLTAYNSDEFINLDAFSEVIDTVKSQDLTDNTIIVVNKVSSNKQYQELVDFVKENNIKILPVLKHPNSFSVLEKTTPSTIHDLVEKCNNSDILILVDENPAEYLDKEIGADKKIISVNTTKKLFQDSDVNIPVRAWYEQEGSFTNNEGKTQEFIDTIQDDTNELKTIRMVFDELENAL